jgi:hypothetical protein
MSYRCDVGGIERVKKWPAMGLAIALFAVAGCSDGSDTTPDANQVVAADAYIAVVDWEVSEHDPVMDEDGDVELPVVYVAPADGETIDVGIQAAVVEATVDIAIVRFADEAAEALDADTEGEPVKDDGVLLIVGDLPEPSRTIELVVVRYQSIEDDSMLTVEITASADGAAVTSTLQN